MGSSITAARMFAVTMEMPTIIDNLRNPGDGKYNIVCLKVQSHAAAAEIADLNKMVLKY